MVLRSAVLFALALASAVALRRVDDTEPPRAPAALEALPLDIGEWHGHDDPGLDERTRAVLGVDDYITRTYRSAQTAVGVYVGYWASQRQGDTMHSPLNCLPGAGWTPLSRRSLDVRVADAASGQRDIAINRYLVERAGDRELVLYWYQARGRIVASEYLSRMFQVIDAVRLHRTDGALVRVMLHDGSDDPADTAAERDGVRFVTALFPLLASQLPS